MYQVYRERMELTIAPFLCHANAHAAEQGRQAYVHAVGLGLGVWMVDPVQVKDQLAVYARVLQREQFKHIADIDFSWFGSETECGGCGHGDKLHGVTLHFSKRNVADPLPGNIAKGLEACVCFFSKLYTHTHTFHFCFVFSTLFTTLLFDRTDVELMEHTHTHTHTHTLFARLVLRKHTKNTGEKDGWPE